MKRLIVCCDGTWQQLASPYPNNIVKLAQSVKPMTSDGVPQIVFYDEGIGNDPGLFKLARIKFREVGDTIEELHESTIKRLQNRKDYRPKNIEKILSKLTQNIEN